MKKFLITLFIIILLGGAGYFAYRYFDLGQYLDFFNKTEKTKDKEKPKLQIIDEDSDSRVIGVAINNHPDARPHSGLQDSFLNYEVVAEGDITRILAFFKDKETARIGSVRSARHYFIDYMLENDAIFVHYGHSDFALSDIETYGIDDIDGMFYDNAFFRDDTLDRDYEHTAFTSMELINNAIADRELRSTSSSNLLLKYSIENNKINEREDAIKADEVYVNYFEYTSTKYIYDTENKNYKRYMDGEAHVDAETGLQYTAKNIIVYKVANHAIDDYGRQNLDNVGEGEGYYITEGYAVPINWSKSDRAAKTIYTYSDGTEIKVNDGNTWIQIQPKNKLLDIIEYDIPEEITEETSEED